MNEICGDNRFEIIEKAKNDLLESTNIHTSPDEMKVLDTFLFRCWQKGWLDRFDDTKQEQSRDIHWATEQAYKNGKEAGKPKWISGKDRLPSKEEYTAKAKDGEEYYVRLLIAYKTDIIEYEIGYYDGYKWMTEMPIRIIKDVVAWMPFPNLPQPPKGE